MAEKERLQIELCMGSSCFARGNNNVLSILEEYIAENGLEDRIELGGHLCLGRCSTGPHIMIGGKEYSGIVDSACITDIVAKTLEEMDADPDIH